MEIVEFKPPFKLALGGDRHKLAKDKTTIEGYVECNIAIGEDLISTVKNLNLDAFISLGDWFDGGYTDDTNAALDDADQDKRFNSVLNGNFFGVIGNHIKNKMDSNPELNLIQPHPVLKTRRPSNRGYQIIRTPDIIKIGNVQITLNHWSGYKHSLLDYKVPRMEWATYHICVFHTPWVIPNQQMAKANKSMHTYSNGQIGKVLEGIELAICGDIHNPLGKFTVSHDYGSTVMIVPGSMTNTDASLASRHTMISMPVITIGEDSSVNLSFHEFGLRTNMLKFKTTAKDSGNKKEPIKSLKGRVEYEKESGETKALFNMDASEFTMANLIRALSYTDQEVRMIQTIMADPANVDKIFDIGSELPKEI